MITGRVTSNNGGRWGFICIEMHSTSHADDIGSAEKLAGLSKSTKKIKIKKIVTISWQSTHNSLIIKITCGARQSQDLTQGLISRVLSLIPGWLGRSCMLLKSPLSPACLFLLHSICQRWRLTNFYKPITLDFYPLKQNTAEKKIKGRFQNTVRTVS